MLGVLALGLGAGGSAVAAPAEKYFVKGEGSKGKKSVNVAFNTREEKINSAFIRFRNIPCARGRENVKFEYTFGTKGRFNPDGRFRMRYRKPDYKLVMAGKVLEDGTTVQGRVRGSTEDVPSLLNRGCDSGKIKWTGTMEES